MQNYDSTKIRQNIMKSKVLIFIYILELRKLIYYDFFLESIV